MSDALYRHYESELLFIRQMAREFSKRYPGPPGRLQLKDNESTDPHGEHDFGSFELVNRKFFWKIDYYDERCEFGSEDPSDPKLTTRVLTLMLATEY